jgi:hypothetical protein
MADKRIDSSTVVERYRQVYGDKFKKEQLEENVSSLEKLLGAEKTYPAEADIVSFVIVQKVSLTTYGGDKKKDLCFATTGGACTGGFGVTGGDIYTDDMAGLLANTAWIGFAAAAAYLHIDFYNKDHKIIGHFEGGGLSSVIGGGGGAAGWYSAN